MPSSSRSHLPPVGALPAAALLVVLLLVAATSAAGSGPAARVDTPPFQKTGRSVPDASTVNGPIPGTLPVSVSAPGVLPVGASVPGASAVSASAAGALTADAAYPGRESAPALAVTNGFRWPLDGVPRPVRRFDPPPRPWLAGHRGVDLATAAAAVVRAAGDGIVSFAGQVAGRPVVSVSHPGGLRTSYEPVRPAVVAGDRVAAGDLLGVLLPGHAGCPAEACLHWGLRDGARYLDPLALLGLGRIRLLPVGTVRAADRDRGLRSARLGE